MDKKPDLDEVNDWLKQFGKEMGIYLQFDDDCTCALQFNNDVLCVIEVAQENDILLVYSPICYLLDIKQIDASIMRKALELNLFHLKTNGGALAFSESVNQILFCFTETLSTCNNALFSTILRNFAETACSLKKEFDPFFKKEFLKNDLSL